MVGLEWLFEVEGDDPVFGFCGDGGDGLPFVVGGDAKT